MNIGGGGAHTHKFVIDFLIKNRIYSKTENDIDVDNHNIY